jgi:2-polyprenyl-3-methyl-5-hydroxy-6-metoxy-1,4-benzoquinol methylase
LEERFEEEAAAWAAWIRRDVYPHYAPAFFDLVPPPGRATLDVGCGEGRVTRDLTARGHSTVGVDLSRTLVRMAAEADLAGDYRVAHASELPFDDGAFDLVVAYNVLMDVDALGAAVEAVREPPGGPEQDDRWRRVPMFLMLRALKPRT